MEGLHDQDLLDHSGVVPIAHNSGGPREDIVQPAREGGQPNGFLCEAVEEYADALTTLLCMTSVERQAYAAAARRYAPWADTSQTLIFEMVARTQGCILQ